jgi:hypothetical protein
MAGVAERQIAQADACQAGLSRSARSTPAARSYGSPLLLCCPHHTQISCGVPSSPAPSAASGCWAALLTLNHRRRIVYVMGGGMRGVVQNERQGPP